MVGVNKLEQAIERVDFIARQFALWAVPEEWFNSEQKPDFGVQASTTPKEERKKKESTPIPPSRSFTRLFTPIFS
jgi:hypothetical protein